VRSPRCHSTPRHPDVGDAVFRGPSAIIGNAASFSFPVRYRTVGGATPQRVVRERASGLLDRFVAAANELVENGAIGITTSCGFPRCIQPELTAGRSRAGGNVEPAPGSLAGAPAARRTFASA